MKSVFYLVHYRRTGMLTEGYVLDSVNVTITLIMPSGRSTIYAFSELFKSYKLESVVKLTWL
jgi:hypothetical protein